jgi:hypothetical protein
VKKLIVATLQKRRVDGKDRFGLRYVPAAKVTSMLPAMPTSKKRWKVRGKPAKTGAAGHGGSNGTMFSSSAALAQGIAENCRIGSGYPPGLVHPAGSQIERADTVEQRRVLLGGWVPVAFFSQHMNKDGIIEVSDFLECHLQLLQIVTVNRANIFKAKCLEKHARSENPFQ